MWHLKALSKLNDSYSQLHGGKFIHLPPPLNVLKVGAWALIEQAAR